MDGSPRKRARRSNSFSSLFGTDPSSSSEEDEVILTHGRKPIPLHNGGSLMVPSTITRPHTAVTNAPLIRRKVNLILPPRTQIRPTEARHTVKHKNLRWAKDNVEEIAPIKTTIVSEKPAQAELRNGTIQIIPVEHDKRPKSLVLLTGLKSLFRKQLPQMPGEYIARLVYDTNSRCLAIVKHGYQVVGGICHRPFPHRGFTEIAFFAVASVDQVKGYGGMLMDHFKAHIRETYPSIDHFLTYADNYAVGYFRKQGFTKEITLDPSLWIGYIKDYEGGTIMECAMLPKVDYRRVGEIIQKQQEAILTRIGNKEKENPNSHTIYPGLRWWKKGNTGPIDPRRVPGLRELSETIVLTKHPDTKNVERLTMKKLLADLQGHSKSWPFMQPVNPDEVPGYYDHIKKPMDFATMEHKLETKQYTALEDFIADAKLVFSNCKWYNAPDTIYHKAAIVMELFFKDRISQLRSQTTGKRKRED